MRHFILLILLISSTSHCGTLKPSGDDYVPNNKMVENNMLRGIEYMKLEKYDIALERLKEALRTDPNYGEAHNAIAVLYEQIGRTELAQEHYENALQLKPKNSDIHNNYGQFLCKLGRWQAADEHFLKAIENPLYRTPHIPYANAALCALRNQDKNKAEVYLRKSLQLEPRFESALYWISQLSYEQQRYQESRDYLKRYTQVAEHTAASLWLGYQIETALNNPEEAAKYAEQLRSLYPDSEQNRQLIMRSREKP